jgi:ectoine hydroxylase-related dioxygenase (phytanoyl-CoA dioxygenase family)
LGLRDHCAELAQEGWTVIRDVAPPSFTEQLREKILEVSNNRPACLMLLAKDPIFSEAMLNPALIALAEYSVGRGFLISQVAATIREKGSPALDLHADQNWLPAPFPAHNMLLTVCWTCDEFSEPAGSTLVIPGSGKARRHPNDQEIAARKGAIAVECPTGSAVIWDGSIWHGNYPRVLEGKRIVCHITYSRLAMRPVEDYSRYADSLIEKHGDVMAQLLGRQDALFSAKGIDYTKVEQTYNNAKR